MNWALNQATNDGVISNLIDHHIGRDYVGRDFFSSLNCDQTYHTKILKNIDL